MILLINPPYFERDELKERFSSYREWIRKGNMYAVAFEPPVGISELASFLNQKGRDAKILDIPGHFLSNEEVESEILRLKPQIAGITTMSATVAESLRIAKSIKRISPSTTVVIGGVHPTVMPESILEKEYVDYVVRGEGEFALLDIDKVVKGDSSADILNKPGNGICFKNGKVMRISEKAPLIDDIDDIPLADYGLFPAENYIKYNEDLRGLKGISMIAGRGCPYSCTFCAVNKTMGRLDRRRSPEVVTKKISELAERYGIGGIWFKDSTFNLDPGWVGEFCALVKKEMPSLKWQINTRVDLVRDNEIAMMKDAGLVQIDLGIESGAPSTLALLDKKYSVEDIEKSVDRAKKYVKVAGFFMIGLPGESESDIDKTFELAKRLELDSYSFSIFSPLPGTKLFENLLMEGKISGEKWTYSNSHFTKTAESFCFLDREKLTDKYAEINDYFSSI